MANEKSNKQSNKLQWFLFVIVIPVVFAITLMMVVATIMGVNPIKAAQDFGSNVPVISSFITDPEEEQNEQEVAEYEATVQDQQTTIDNLESQLTSKDQEIDELIEQVNVLEQQLEADEEGRLSRSEATDRLARSYAEMEAERASAIIVEMEQPLALDILEQMNDEQRGEILSGMESSVAANFSNALIRRSEVD
ncbi:hypothetical protein [Halalkalibacillus halophilus]|uniref:hypothetical protein n=1 Tax=Halalkalibacillus halophilus TaxID=392827 RepID=UPI000406A134|nr:hypothetical protein [Halalkalibacillus halophilus]